MRSDLNGNGKESCFLSEEGASHILEEISRMRAIVVSILDKLPDKKFLKAFTENLPSPTILEEREKTPNVSSLFLS